MKNCFYLNLVLLLVLLADGCSTARSLREEAFNDGEEDLKSLRRPPTQSKPISLLDRSLTKDVEGTLMDYSGKKSTEKPRMNRETFDRQFSEGENSLWRDSGQSNFFFSQNKQRSAGDLISLELDKDFKKGIYEKMLPSFSVEAESGIEIPGISQMVPKTAEGQDSKTSSSSGPSSSKEEPQAPQMTSKITDGSFFMTAEVIQKFPNENLLVRGVKKIVSQGQNRTLEVTAIIRNQDLTENDVVQSPKFLESKVEVYR